MRLRESATVNTTKVFCVLPNDCTDVVRVGRLSGCDERFRRHLPSVAELNESSARSKAAERAPKYRRCVAAVDHRRKAKVVAFSSRVLLGCVADSGGGWEGHFLFLLIFSRPHVPK